MGKEFYSNTLKLMKSLARGNQSSRKIIGSDASKTTGFKAKEKAKSKGSPSSVVPSKTAKPSSSGKGKGGK